MIALALFCLVQQSNFGFYDAISEFHLNHRAYDLRVCAVGDVDHDGCDDYLVSDQPGGYGGPKPGLVWLVTGRTGAAQAHFRGVRSGDLLGTGLAELGDLDPDGEMEYALGAPYESSYGSTPYPGRVEVRSGVAGTLRYELRGFAAADAFGSTVGAIGDADGDGAADFFVSAPDENRGSLGLAGGIHVYSGRLGQLLYSVGGWYGGMRLSVHCAVGDMDGDGVREIAGYSNGTAEYYFFSGAAGQLLFTLPRDRYDDVVAPLADLDGDGVEEFAVLRREYSGLHRNAGRMEVWSGSTAALLYALDGRERDLLGSGVCVLGDLDDDRVPELAVGCTGRNQGGILNTGAIIIVSGASGAPLDAESRLQRKDRFGEVRDSGDFDADGQPDMLIACLGTRSADKHALAAAFRRELMIHPSRLSAAQGGVARIAVSQGRPYLPYRLLLTGSGPGAVQWKGVTVPLQPDAWSHFFLRHPPAFVDFPRGTLDAYGRASIRIDLPPGALNFAGQRLDFAVLATDFRGVPDWCSNSVSLLIDP